MPKFTVTFADSDKDRPMTLSAKNLLGAAIKASRLTMGSEVVSIVPFVPKMVERVNLMSGQKYMEAEDTPLCCSPASETYWSM